MVCGLSTSAGFQPALPTASRWRTKVWMRVSSRRKCVCMSMMNWSLSALARSCAMAGVAASALLTSKTAPKVSFMATKAAAMPAAVWKNWRRSRPCFLPSSSPMSSRRASTSFCCSLCGAGMYSSLEMICVGIGVVCGSISAGISASSSSLVRKPMGFLPE